MIHRHAGNFVYPVKRQTDTVASVLPELRDERAELVAVLSAAAAVAIEEECRIVSVKLAAPDMSFARQGRMQIFASKNYTPVKFN